MRYAIKRFIPVILCIILLSVPALPALAEDNGSGNSSPLAMVWQTIFMLLTVIPVSKMLSSIFMKLVVRNSTVNENKWGMIGLGSIATAYGLMRRQFGGKIQGFGNPFGGQGITSGRQSNPRPGLTSPSVGSGSTSNTSPAGPGTPSPNGGLGMEANSSAMRNTPGSGAGYPSGYTQTKSGIYLPAGMNGTSSGTSSGDDGSVPSPVGNIPEKGKRSLNDIIKMSSNTGNNVARKTAMAGVAASFAVPEAAPIVAGAYGAAGKAVTGFTSTAHNLASEIATRQKNGQSFWQASKEITGTNNRIAATTKMATTLGLSPAGRRVTNFGLNTPGKVYGGTKKAVQWTKGKLGRNV